MEEETAMSVTDPAKERLSCKFYMNDGELQVGDRVRCRVLNKDVAGADGFY